MKANSVLYLFLFLFSAVVQAQTETDQEFRKEVFIKDADTLRYRILYPVGYSEEKEYPVLLFLHGAGERGSDNRAQLVHGSSLFLDQENRKRFPAIVIFPQVPKEDYWAQVEVNREVTPFEFDYRNKKAPTPSMRLTMQLLETLKKKDYVDQDRIYVGGLSMGGMGTFEILYRMPETFAAAFAICGGADPSITESYPEGFNIWIFHGEKDSVVPADFSKTMARAINTNGGNAKLSLYPEYNHNSWDAALKEPYLLPWLFSHKK